MNQKSLLRALFCAAALLASSAVLSAASPLNLTADLVDDKQTVVLTSFDIGMLNPLLGARAILEVRKLGGFMSLEASANGGVGIDPDDNGEIMLAMGGFGFSADATVGFRFAYSTWKRTYFYAINSWRSGYNTITYQGYNLPYTDHLDHYLELGVRLDNTGVFAASGSVNPLTSAARYELKPGYSLYLNLKYSVKGEHRFSLLTKGTDVIDVGYWSFSLGPVFTPTFSQYGGLAEFVVVKEMSRGFFMDIRASFGAVIRDSIPDGFEWYTDDRSDPWRSSEGREGIYFPFCLTFGITLPSVK